MFLTLIYAETAGYDDVSGGSRTGSVGEGMCRDNQLFLVLLCRRAYVSRNDMLTG